MMNDIQYHRVDSQPVEGLEFELPREGIAVIDVNGDARKDIVIAQTGPASQPVAEGDPPILILLAEADGTFRAADTHLLPNALNFSL